MCKKNEGGCFSANLKFCRNVCWDSLSLNPPFFSFFLILISSLLQKKDSKNEQPNKCMHGLSYFGRALTYRYYLRFQFNFYLWCYLERNWICKSPLFIYLRKWKDMIPILGSMRSSLEKKNDRRNLIHDVIACSKKNLNRSKFFMSSTPWSSIYKYLCMYAL